MNCPEQPTTASRLELMRSVLQDFLTHARTLSEDLKSRATSAALDIGAAAQVWDGFRETGFKQDQQGAVAKTIAALFGLDAEAVLTCGLDLYPFMVPFDPSKISGTDMALRIRQTILLPGCLRLRFPTH